MCLYIYIYSNHKQTYLNNTLTFASKHLTWHNEKKYCKCYMRLWVLHFLWASRKSQSKVFLRVRFRFYRRNSNGEHIYHVCVYIYLYIYSNHKQIYLNNNLNFTSKYLTWHNEKRYCKWYTRSWVLHSLLTLCKSECKVFTSDCI